VVTAQATKVNGGLQTSVPAVLTWTPHTGEWSVSRSGRPAYCDATLSSQDAAAWRQCLSGLTGEDGSLSPLLEIGRFVGIPSVWLFIGTEAKLQAYMTQEGNTLSGSPASSEQSLEPPADNPYPFKRRVESHLPSAGIIRSSPYSPR